MDYQNAPHRHLNADRDAFTHQHDHDAEHCGGDCDVHAPVRRREPVGGRAAK